MSWLQQERAAYFLVGPTAVGKTAVAQYLAEQRNSSILSADSMLIYRGMDIGTAKPTAAERGDVPYYGIDLVAPDSLFSVWDYREHALETLAKVQGAEGGLIVTGGTGLYVKSLTHGLSERPGADADLRTKWEMRIENDGIQSLQRAAQEADPESYAELADQDNPRRLIRLLESAAATVAGKADSWQTVESSAPLVGLTMDTEFLNERIEKRVQHMYATGLVDEVEALVSQAENLSRTAAQAIGYAEAIQVLNGELSREEAIRKTVVRTRRLAKRQRTWFRHQARVEWVEVKPDATLSSIAGEVDERWGEYGPTIIKCE